MRTHTHAGMWTGGSGGMAVPNKTARGYDWQDTSSSSHATIVKLLKKADYGLDHDYEGAYTCVRAYGSQPITFALHALLTPCPASYDAAGAPLMCQSPLAAPQEQRRYSDCSAAGECVCTGQYAKPLPSVFPGGWVGSACWVTFCLPSCPTCLPFPLPSCLPSTCPLPISSAAGIGFEDCSTPVMNISRTELAANRSFQLEHERVEPDQ